MSEAYVETTSLRKILAMTRKYRFASGGTGAAKTSSIMQVLIDMAASKPNIRIDVVAETSTTIRRGAWQDANKILMANNYFDSVKTTSSPELKIAFGNGSAIYFISVDKVSKAHGGRRFCLFINEANHIPWPIADQLIVRTEGPVYCDWNPSAEFWAYEEIIHNPSFKGQWDFVTLTYKDNEGLPKSVVEQIETRKSNIQWWKVYGEGLLGSVKGKVFPDWQIIDKVPFEATLVRRGLDFGFANDSTAIVALYEYNGGYILDEECYSTGMMNPQIADYLSMLKNPGVLIVADSSEPKSIAEIRAESKDVSLNILGAKKWSNYKRDAADFLNTLKISMTVDSVNLRKEVEQYFWLEDRISGNLTNNLPDGNDHAIDATFYAFNPLIVSNNRKKKESHKTNGWEYASVFGGVR